jgi:acid phosphatase
MHRPLRDLDASRALRPCRRVQGRWDLVRRGWILVLAAALVAPSCAPAPQPTLVDFKASLVRYVDSQRYAGDVRRVTARAERYLRRAAPAAERPALVLDIDETSLSNWRYQLESHFCYDADDFHHWVLRREAEAIAGVLDLYTTARELGVTVFFVTGRPEAERAATEDNLRAVGFASWAELHMRPADSGGISAAAFKSGVRQRIVEADYTILANVGDQESDLAGGFASRTFKLPNPFYEVP